MQRHGIREKSTLEAYVQINGDTHRNAEFDFLKRQFLEQC